MLLKSITMKNFMPYKGLQTIEFPIKSSENVTVIFGDNMRGKTSILNAFRWGFYEVALGRHSKALPLHELPNKEAGLEGDWDMEVQIKFSADEHEYDIRRMAIKRKHVAKPEREDDYEISTSMLKDGMALPASQIPSEINKFAPEQVSRFFLFDGELLQEYETLLIDGNEQGKKIKDAIEQVLGVPSLIRGRELSNVLLRKAQKQQNHEMVQFAGSERLVHNRRQLQESLDSIERDIRAIQARQVDVVEERTLLDDQLDKVESIYQAKAKIDAKRDELKRIESEIEILINKKHILMSESWKILIGRKTRERIVELQASQKVIQESIQQSGNLKLKIDHLRAILDLSKCPTCDQDVSNEHRNQAGYRLGELESLRDSEDRTIELSNIHHEIQKLSRFDAIRNLLLINDVFRQIQDFQVRQIKIESDIESLSQEIRGFDTAEITRKRGKRDSLIKEESRNEQAVTTQQKKLAEISKEIRLIDANINALPEARAKRSSKLVELYSALERVFSDSIEKLRDDLRLEVEKCATKAFLTMITQKKYSGLRINSNYGLTILDEDNNAVNIRSAGAEQIVALSLIDGLSHIGRAAGPVIMDTPFGRLDMKHRDNILSYLPNTAKQLILLVHDGEIRSHHELSAIASRIGSTYTIIERGSRHSEIRRD